MKSRLGALTILLSLTLALAAAVATAEEPVAGGVTTSESGAAGGPAGPEGDAEPQGTATADGQASVKNVAGKENQGQEGDPEGGILDDTDGPPEGSDPEAPEPRQAKAKLRLRGLSGKKLEVGRRVIAQGILRPFTKGEKVTIALKRGKKTIKRKTVRVKQRKKGSKIGQFELQADPIKSGRYSFVATHKKSSKLDFSRSESKRFKVKYPKLREGNRSSTVKLFNKLLARQGYVNDEGKRYDSATSRAVLAFRKVHGMSRYGDSAPSSIFKKLANGKGGYKLKYPGSGKHVEIDISRQVMVLAKGSKVKEIYHVSTGAPATPTIPGAWRFYRKEAGTNSLGMQWSVYYNRGYATHGFKSVPTYPASHGCTRNPPPDALHIYNWISIGDLVHVYR